MIIIDKITSFKHWSLVIFSAITFLGYLYYDWALYQILFFAYLHTLARVPTLYFIHKFHYKSTSIEKNESGVFLVFYSIFFLLYSFFFIGLIHYASFGMGKYFDVFFQEMMHLFSGYSIPIFVLILMEYMHYVRVTKSPIETTISSNSFAFKNVLQLVTYFPILVLLYFVLSNALVVGLFEVFLFIGVNAFYEIVILKDKDMYSVDKNSPNWKVLKF